MLHAFISFIDCLPTHLDASSRRNSLYLECLILDKLDIYILTISEIVEYLVSK